MRKFAAFDIDGTLIRWQLYHAIVDALIRLDYVSPDDFESIKQSRMQWKRRLPGASFKSYESELVRVYETTLTSISPKQLNQAIDEVFGEYRDQVYVYTRTLIDELKSQGYLLFAISGSQTEIVAKVAEYYGFDAFIGTEYEIKANKFTGRSVFHAENKDIALRKMMSQFSASVSGSYAVGDSMGDAKMLAMVENPIAFNPEKSLWELAEEKGWKVVLERKNVIYELETDGNTYILAKTS